MPTFKSAVEKEKAEAEFAELFEKARACVNFAIHKLEDVWYLEVALLKGATPLSEAKNLMESVKRILGEILGQLENVNAASSLEFEKDWVSSIIEVGIETERVILDFLEEAGKRKPNLPEAVQRISTKPVSLPLLNRLGSQMSEIKSRLQKITKNISNNGDGTSIERAILGPALQSPPFLTIEEMGLVGYKDPQERIINKLLDPNTPQLLQIAIVCPETRGKSTLAQNIYQRVAEKNHFHICFWLFDMNNSHYERPKLFKPIDMLRKMLLKLEPGNPSDRNELDEDQIIQRICECLNGKRYLAVIDNVSDYKDSLIKLFP